MIKRGKTFNFETGREDDPPNVIQTEIFESTDKDVDFDQLNDENMNYSRYGGSQNQQQSQNIMSEEIDPKKAMTTFNKIAEENEKERFQLKRSRQV